MIDVDNAALAFLRRNNANRRENTTTTDTSTKNSPTFQRFAVRSNAMAQELAKKSEKKICSLCFRERREGNEEEEENAHAKNTLKKHQQ